MKMLVVLTALVAVCAGKDFRQEFREAYAKFSKPDGLMSEPPVVLEARYQQFKKFAAVVEAVNGDDSDPMMAEANFLSILSDDEIHSHMGFNASGHENDDSPPMMMMSSENVAVPESRDFSGVISGIKNQGNCGSCWTFAATAALEGEMYFRNSQKGVSLSEQEYMECATRRDGCQGGWMEDCYTYSRSKDRIAPTSAAPYKGKDSRRCNYGSVANALTQTGVKVTGNINIKGDKALLQYASKHVVSVAIKVSNKFMVYKSGVLVDSTCNVQPDHAVAVVGYGVEKGRKYWKVRNSWGTGWGDAGYVKMDRQKDNMCMISTYSHIPRVECRGSDCKEANPDDGSDDSDDNDDGKDDDNDDSDDKKDDIILCHVKIGLGVCEKNAAAVKKSCENKGIAEKDCVIAKLKKCFYGPHGKENAGRNYVDVMMPCNDQDDKDDDTKCDAAAGLVFCKDCNCCKHEHMCHNKL